MQWAKGMGIGTTGSSQATAKRQQLADTRWEIKADWNQAIGIMLTENDRQSNTQTGTAISHLKKATKQDQSKVVKRQQIASNEDEWRTNGRTTGGRMVHERQSHIFML